MQFKNIVLAFTTLFVAIASGAATPLVNRASDKFARADAVTNGNFGRAEVATDALTDRDDILATSNLGGAAAATPKAGRSAKYCSDPNSCSATT